MAKSDKINNFSDYKIVNNNASHIPYKNNANENEKETQKADIDTAIQDKEQQDEYYESKYSFECGF